MRGWVGVLALLALAGCAPGLDRLKPALDANDVGTVWFTILNLWNPEATEAARRNVRAQLAELLK